MQDTLSFISHHVALFLALIVVLIILIILEFLKIKRGTTRLSPAQVTRLINHDKGVVIDIRSVDAFTNGHITGALSLPLNDLKDKIKKIEKFKAQPIIVVCATGIDSPKAATLLLQQGFQAQILNGGIRAWADAELPLVKG